MNGTVPPATSRTTAFRRRFGGASLLAATVLFAAAEVLYPTEGNDPATEIATNAAHHGQLLAAIACTLLSSLLFLPALFALMNPVHRRGAVLAHLGGGMAILGFAVSGLALVGVQFVMYEASAPGVDRHAVATFISQATSDPIGAPLVLGHWFIVLGVVALAVGLVRGGIGYRWAAIALGAGPLLDAVLGSAGLEKTPSGALMVTILSDVVWIAGAAGLAWWQVTTTDAAWEGTATPEVTDGPRESVAVPA
jgi:hypothetical protein